MFVGQTVLARPYDQHWYIHVDRNSTYEMMFGQPSIKPVGKGNKIKRILYRADRPHQADWYRYYRHISNREYIDCSYYKYVDCTNFEFCRCWQCKDYAYRITHFASTSALLSLYTPRG